MKLEGDKGGKQIIKRHLNDVAKYEIPAREAEDIDTKILKGKKYSDKTKK